MLIGPVFTRELATAPRRVRFYAAPAVYLGGLLVLTCTAWLLMIGTQQVRNVGDMARFGVALFQFLAPLQLVLAVFFSALGSASAVAQEKDRRTLELLLLTNLSNSELVLGKLLASMLNVLVLLAAGLPFFMLIVLFGGVSFEQILRVFAVTFVTALAAGSLGSTIALWREKTFQTLALTALVAGDSRGLGGAVGQRGAFHFTSRCCDQSLVGRLSPWQAVLAAARPQLVRGARWLPIGSAYQAFIALAAGADRWREFDCDVDGAGVESVEGSSIPRRRCRRVPHGRRCRRCRSHCAGDRASVHAAPGKLRKVWDNPILWREVCTWAYGRKVVIVRLVYVALFAATALGVHATLRSSSHSLSTLPATVLPLIVLSLVLVNALAVTSITTERDLGAFDLLLVTDISPLEFIWGKLGGVFLCRQRNDFAARGTGDLFVHCRSTECGEFGLSARRPGLDEPVRRHTGHSLRVDLHQQPQRGGRQLGHRVFLVRRRRHVHAHHDFLQRLVPTAIGAVFGIHDRRQRGTVCRFGARNPSQAIGLASLLLPVLTFVAITGFLQGDTLGVFLIVEFTYGLTTAAMLVPAISEFDVATGRTTD